MPELDEDKIVDTNTDSNTEEEFDTAAALADISKDLFGQDSEEENGEDSTKVETLEEPSPPTEVEPPASQTEGEENSPEVQEIGAPKTWTKEALETWAAIPPRAKQEILKREQDMFAGIAQYKERADIGSKYESVIEPYRPMLAASNIDPVGLFQSFAANHYLLSQGTPQQKLDLVLNMLSGYQIDPVAIVERLTNQTPRPQISPEVLQLQQELQQIKGSVQQREQAEYQAHRAKIQSEVDAFAADPKNIHFLEVADHIGNLLKTGVASTLQQAYEQAVWANPGTRQKELDRMSAVKISEAQEVEKKRVQAANAAKSANLKTTTKTRDGTIPVGSMDETLEETLAKIQARG